MGGGIDLGFGRSLDGGLSNIIKVPGNFEKDVFGGWDFVFNLIGDCELKKDKIIFEACCSVIGCEGCSYRKENYAKIPLNY